MPKEKLDLVGRWEFKEYPASARRMSDLDDSDWLPATVPGSIYTALIGAGLLKEDELLAEPEKFKDVSDRPWVFKRTFDIPEQILACDRIELVFDGLDTITKIWFNGKLLGKTNNMFVPHRFDVTSSVKPGVNSILVKFEPAEEYAAGLLARYGSFSEKDFEKSYCVFIRKAQYQFGGDFCPALPGCGIWQGVRLEGIKKTRIKQWQVRTVDCNERYADMKIAVKLDTVSKEEYICRVTISGDSRQITQQLAVHRGDDEFSTVIRIDSPSLWWPAGYGSPNLYKIDVEIFAGQECVEKTDGHFGIRTVRLNKSFDNKEPKFEFEINGVPVYAKGASWVPPSVFPGAVTDQMYQRLLSAAAGANINMLRICGGGYYETDNFYRLCDKLGIMVWQDFMFACAYYPDRQWFIDESQKEAADVITRLRNHPCVVLWCGNSEIDRMHSAGELGTGRKFYGREIFHKILPHLVAQMDGDNPYIPSTPLADGDGYRKGVFLTVHRRDVWTGHKPVAEYIRADKVETFVAEFGLQSMPSMGLIKKMCPRQVYRLGSLPVEKHNYQAGGNSRLYRYVADLFGTTDNLERFIYFSQVAQGRAAKLYVEHLRASRGKNSGVLFRQFNDSFPAISWSAIDYEGVEKALLYYVRRFYSGLLVTVVFEPAGKENRPVRPTQAFVINDTEKPVTGTLFCRLTNLHGQVLDQAGFPVFLGPFNSAKIIRLPQSITRPKNPEDAALHLLLEKDDIIVAENLFLYLPDKHLNWPAIKIEKKLTKIGEHNWQLEVKSNVPAKDLYIRTGKDVKLSDNFFDLPANRQKTITITSQIDTEIAESEISLMTVSQLFRQP
jgi:beta-mannosidase